MLQRVTVWLEDCSPDLVAFVHALEWATRLHAPLRCVRIPKGEVPDESRRPCHLAARQNCYPRLRLVVDSGNCSLQSCADSCRLNYVPWELSDDRDVPLDGLNVVGAYLPIGLREQLARRANAARFATLICAPEWTPVRRVLLLNDDRRGDQAFFHQAAAACALFEVVPVVLTVAATEREARLAQQFAQEILADHRRPAHFDYTAYCSLHAAVQLEAHCRRCSHVFLRYDAAAPRWRWLRGDSPLPMSELSRNLTFLSLPTDDSYQGFADIPVVARASQIGAN